MKYLLDTHSFIWAIFEKKKLSQHAAAVILDPENEILVSAVTFWEISMKYSLGKILLENAVPDDLPLHARKAGFEILDPTPEEFSTSYRLPRHHHRDPFDRLIIWQCLRNDARLISKDRAFEEYGKLGLTILW